MPSIYSDEMRENILADFSSKNPKVSASIIERFGENPRSKGIGALEAEQYRAAVDAPLYAEAGTTGGLQASLYRMPMDIQKAVTPSFGSNLKDFFLGAADSKPDLKATDVVELLGQLYKLFGVAGKDEKAPSRAPQYRAPKSAEIKGVGGIGMNDGGTVLNRRLFLGGGEVDGAGGERDDLVPIWASDREYVVSANGVKRMGGGNHARGIAALDEVNNNGRLV